MDRKPYPFSDLTETELDAIISRAQRERAILAAGGDRNHERMVAARPAVGESDLHSEYSLGRGGLFIPPLRGRAEDANRASGAIVEALQGCNRR